MIFTKIIETALISFTKITINLSQMVWHGGELRLYITVFSETFLSFFKVKKLEVPSSSCNMRGISDFNSLN